MKLFSLKPSIGSVVWIEPNKLVAGGKVITTTGLPSEDQLAQALTHLPAMPTKWIIDDNIAPSMVVKDIVEIPKGTEARESFFKWKFSQALAIEGNFAVQGLSLGEQGWLLSGIPFDLQETWINLAAKMGRPLHLLIPRWLWLYNRVAPTREKPGMVLSLLKTVDDKYTGSIATWNRTLSLLRQWPDATEIPNWISDRIEPTLAYLNRDNRTPAEILIWGPMDWPVGTIPHKVFQSEIPNQEAI
ncbi:MAG: hypothetical protein FWG02_01215 [Holophagaceae bacterium]|nr:hypothetical protein [Holophagaceae bacterium]